VRNGAIFMSLQSRIEINPKVMLGKPVIRGTRIRVELILRKLAEGATIKDLLEAYPHLTSDDIQAAIRFNASGTHFVVRSRSRLPRRNALPGVSGRSCLQSGPCKSL
jgi:uncharacterized protein (DUF433 family)